MSAPRGDMAAQTVLGHLGRGRDASVSLGALSERLGWTRRAVEFAVRALRLEGWPVASNGRGVWLADPVELDATIASLQRRLVSQYVTLRALRRAQQRLGGTQTTLWGRGVNEPRMAAGPSAANDELCRCGHQRRRHHLSTQPYPHTCANCSCLFFEDAPDGSMLVLYRDEKGHFTKEPRK